MKRQKTSEATMSWFESMRGSKLIISLLRQSPVEQKSLVCHLLATSAAKGCLQTQSDPDVKSPQFQKRNLIGIDWVAVREEIPHGLFRRPRC